MPTFIGVFQGRTIDEAKMVAATADPAVIATITAQFLRDSEWIDDPVLRVLRSGERRALRLISHQNREKARQATPPAGGAGRGGGDGKGE
jgi:hypothetical protein